MRSKILLTVSLIFALALAGCKKEPPTPSLPALASITVSPEQIFMVMGQTRQLTALPVPSDAEFTPQWSSTNTSVATVSAEGVVSGVSAGTATVKVASGSVEAEVSVSVYAEEIPLTDIEVPETLMVSLEGTIPMGYKLVPENATDASLTFSCDNTGVATVSAAGAVTGVSMGTANISVKSGKIVKTVRVTVTIKDFSISPGTFTLNAGTGETQQLVMNATPSGAAGIVYTFESSNPAVATVSSSGLVAGVANGQATITVRHANIRREARVTVTGKLLVKVSSSLGGGVAEHLVDGNPESIWHSAVNDPQPWVIVGFEAAKTLYGINYWERNEQGITEADIAASPKRISVWVGSKGEVDSDDWQLLTEADDIAELPLGSRGLARPLVGDAPKTGTFLKLQIQENHEGLPYSYLGEIAFIETAMTLKTTAMEWTDVLAANDPDAGYIHNMVVRQESGYTHLKTEQNSPFESMHSLQDPYVFTKSKAYDLTNAKSASIMLEYKTAQNIDEVEGYFFEPGSATPVSNVAGNLGSGFVTMNSRFTVQSDWKAWEMPIDLGRRIKLPLDRWRLDLPPRTGPNTAGTIYELDVRNVRIVVYE